MMIDTGVLFDLTEREIEILELLNQGLKNKDIATRTNLTLYTVKWYLKQIYSKLHVGNRTQATTKAREFGLLHDDVKRASRVMAAIRTNLPQSVTPFFGRVDDIQQVKDLLIGEKRLVTLHGIGGMGKTRLALQVAHQLLSVFKDGVYFIPLESSNTNPIYSLIETLTLNVTGDNITKQVATYLQNKHMLLIFDNFEHLLSYSTEISHLLEYTRDVRIIVTSREILKLSHEVVISVQGLTFEDTDAAYQLYIQRALSSLSSYAPDEHEEKYIHKICKLVGGMPLAIEMAAGWVSVMSASETYKRIRHNIGLLTSDEHDRPQRHQSIRAIFDYALDSLSNHLRQAVIKLGIFHYDGFTLDGAEAIAMVSPLDLKKLMQVALLERNEHGQFKFHPLIRQYIIEMLKSDETIYLATKDTHCDYYFKFSEYLVSQLNVTKFDLKTIAEFRKEGGNLLIAWYHALNQGYYDRLLTAVEVGYITEMAGNWQLSLKMYYDTLEKTPDEQVELRGRLVALISVFEARLYNVTQSDANARKSWEILKGGTYHWDAHAAMLFLALLKCVTNAYDEAFAILDEIENEPIPFNRQPNAYIDVLNQVGRPLALLYTNQLTEARPLLEQANVPTWAESVIYLPECYYLLGMKDKAHQLLVNLYNDALDNRNHRLTHMIVFYLTLIENEDKDIPRALTNNLLELTRMGFEYKYIITNALYFGVTAMMRGLYRETFYSWYSALSLLDKVNEITLKYQYAHQIVDHLTQLAPKKAAELSYAIIHAPDCPEELKEQARKRLAILPTVSEDKGQTLETVLLTNQH